MATTSSKKKKFSWTSLLALLLAVIPLILEHLNEGRDSLISITTSPDGQKLKAHVTPVSNDGGIEKGKKFSITNK